MSVLVTASFLLLVSGAAVTDIRHRRVPNALALALLASGAVAAVAGAVPARGVVAAFAGTVVGFALWFPFWWRGLLGAGDVKLFAAASAWIGPSLAWRSAMLAALLGGAMSALIISARGLTRAYAARRGAERSGIAAPRDIPATVPYAVPMAIALLWSMLWPDRVARWLS